MYGNPNRGGNGGDLLSELDASFDRMFLKIVDRFPTSMQA